MDSASNLAEDLRHIYINLPSFTDKQTLVQSVVSPLLRYKLVELVLESQYDDTEPICGLPESVADIIVAYFKVMFSLSKESIIHIFCIKILIFIWIIDT